MALVYSYPSGIPIVPYYSTLPSMCESSQYTKEKSYQSITIKRGELVSSGHKTLSSPMGLLTTTAPPATDHTDNKTLLGSCGRHERAEKQVDTGHSSPAAGRGAAKDTGRQSKSEQEGGFLKFGIDRILGVSGTDKKEKSRVGGTGHIQLPVPVFPCNVWRSSGNSRGDGAHSPWHTGRDGTRHGGGSVLEASGEFRVPSAHFCQTCYQGKSTVTPNTCELWSYAHYQQYPYRFDVSRLEAAKDAIPPQILAAQQPPSATGAVRNTRLPGSRRKRSWSRAVFTSLQRKGLEKRFGMQKYVNKPDRRQLAAALGLTDAQVKVWFQNRRMKWRHFQRLQKQQQEQQAADTSCPGTTQRSTGGCSGTDEED